MKSPLVALVLLALAGALRAQDDDAAAPDDAPPSAGASITARYTIEGRALRPETADADWAAGVRIHLNAGERVAFPRKDGSFSIADVPSGSYVVEVLDPDHLYEPTRVEINSRGKFRARKVNHVQTSLVAQVPYPLRLKPLSRARYFQQREQWRLADFLLNPMVLMMVVPLAFIMILPKMMNDPETKKEMEQLTNFRKMQDFPEVSEMITSYFGGGASGSGGGAQQSAKQGAAKAAKSVKKRQ